MQLRLGQLRLGEARLGTVGWGWGRLRLGIAEVRHTAMSGQLGTV